MRIERRSGCLYLSTSAKLLSPFACFSDQAGGTGPEVSLESKTSHVQNNLSIWGEYSKSPKLQSRYLPIKTSSNRTRPCLIALPCAASGEM